MTSPSPVAAAPPTSLSTYAPAPAIGESPTRLTKRKQRAFNQKQSYPDPAVRVQAQIGKI